MPLLMVFVAAFTATLLMEWWREMKIISILSHHEKSIKIIIYLLKKRKNSRRKAFIHHIMGFITNILTQCLPAVLLCVDWNWNWNSNTPTWCNFVFYLCLSNKRQFFSVQFSLCHLLASSLIFWVKLTTMFVLCTFQQLTTSTEKMYRKKHMFYDKNLSLSRISFCK